MMVKDLKTPAEQQALFKAELQKLDLADEKPVIKPAVANARLTQSVLEARADRTGDHAEPKPDRLESTLRDRYDFSDDEP